MSGNVVQQVTMEVLLKGVQEAETKLRSAIQAAEDFGLSGTALNAVTKSLTAQFNKEVSRLTAVAASSKNATKASKEQSTAFQEMVKDVTAASKQLKAASQDAVVGGSTTPLSDAASTMALEEAQTIKAVGVAQKLNAEQVASEVIKQDNAKAASAEKAAKAQVAANAKAEVSQKSLDKARADFDESKILQGLTTEEAALRRVTTAQSDLAKATQARKAAETSGNAGNIATTRDAEAKAYQNLTKQSQAYSNVTKGTSAATTGMAASLPRLRYALYDVSTTFAIAGAAMLAFGAATAGAAITMDRDFADVVRTTGTYLDSTGKATQNLRSDFNELFASLPASWSDLTDIGTLAGQLGVANENVAEFTRLVTMLSTTTDVSVDAAATAIGRLSELLDVAASEYENLGSAILATGTSSVAAESAIINTSSQIASIGAYAGLSADQVIGFSSALASLGVQPELARGTVTRLFSKISVAIADGGDKLDKFASLAGMTAQEFTDAWGTDKAAGAIEQMFEGLSKVEGTGAVTTLNELGITAARDVPTMLKLAQNHELLSEQLDIAAEGYANGTALQEQYGVVSETVAAKLTVLKNNFQLLFASAGEGTTGPLADMIDGLTTLIKGINQLAGNDAVQAISALVLGITVLGGVTLIAAGAFARAVASGAAMRTALIEMAVAGGAYTTSTEAATASTLALATSTKALRVALISTGIGAALVLAGTALAYFGGKADNARDANNALKESFADALSTDTNSDAEGVRTFSVELDNYGESAQDATLSQDAWNRILAGSSTYVDEMAAAVRGATDDVKELNVSIGDATIAQFMKTFTEDADLQDAFNNGLIPTDLDFNTLATKWAEGGDTAANAYINSLYKPEELKAAIAKQTALVQEAEDAFNANTIGLDAQSAQDTPEYKAYWAQAEALAVLQQRLASYDKVLGVLGQNSGAFAEATDKASFAQRVLGDETSNTGDAAGAAGDDFEDYADRITQAMSDATDVINATVDTEAALNSLGESLQAGGNDWSQYTDAGRENIGNLLSAMDAIATEDAGDPTAIASDFQALFDMLVQGGYAAGSQLGFLKEAINNLMVAGGISNIKSSGRDMSSFFNGWSSGATKAAKSTASATKEVRTLLDYAGDLAKVWDRAFEIRFDSQSTYDKITTSFQDMRDAADESAKKIAELNLEINGLQTDIGTQEYFLGIAVNYGDTLRQAEIQQNLAELQADLADKQSDLTDEQASNSKVLTGNSKAAISNREALTGLVSEYEDHIGALAKSGATQAELAAATTTLKQDFIDQATALGYSRAEVDKYADAFQDVATAISRVPRNITVAANVDPAIQAFNELEAAVNKARSSASAPITLGSITNPNNAKELRRYALEGEIAALATQLANVNARGDYVGARSIGQALQDGRRILASGNYWDGGFTGQGGKFEYAGNVHKGEYVVPKRDVNQRTGLPYADAFQRISRGTPSPQGMASGGFAQSSGGRGMVDLSPTSIQQIAMAVKPHLFIDGNQVAQSVSQSNRALTNQGAN